MIIIPCFLSPLSHSLSCLEFRLEVLPCPLFFLSILPCLQQSSLSSPVSVNPLHPPLLPAILSILPCLRQSSLSSPAPGDPLYPYRPAVIFLISPVSIGTHPSPLLLCISLLSVFPLLPPLSFPMTPSLMLCYLTCTISLFPQFSLLCVCIT